VTEPKQQIAADQAAAAPADTAAADVPRRTTSVYLPIPLLDELDELADRLERSRTWIVEKAVREYLTRYKD
jgi:hypothetical protein